MQLATRSLATPVFWTSAFFALLALLLPLGTRYIWSPGQLLEAPIEPGTLSLYGTQLLAALGASAVIVMHRAHWRLAWSSWIVRAGALLAAVALLSAAVSDAPGDSLLHAGWFVAGWLLAAAAAMATLAPKALAAGFVAGGAAQSVLAIAQALQQKVHASTLLGVAEHLPSVAGTAVVETAAGRFLRAYGTFPHPNALGLYLAVALLCALGFSFSDQRVRRRLACICIPVIAIGLLLTFSRAAGVAFVAGLPLLAAAAYQKHAGRRKEWMRAIAPGLALLLAGLAVALIPLRHQLVARTQVATRLEARSVGERAQSLRDGWLLFAQRPLLGVGLGRMPYAASAEIAPLRPSGWSYQNAHAVPVMAMAETGAAGTAALAGIAAAVAVALWRARRRFEADLAEAGLAAACLAVAAAGLFDHFLWSLWPGVLLFWLVLAALESIDRTGDFGMLTPTDELQT